MSTKKITTTIPYEYWKRAMLEDLHWGELLRFAIDVHTEESFLKEKKLKEKIKESCDEIRAYKRQLKKLEEKRVAQKESEKKEKELKRNSCDGCGEELKDEVKIMPDKRRLCKSCFLEV